MKNQLKIEVENLFGRKVTYAKDCDLLSEEIFAATNRKVSSATLRRFFGLLSSKHSASSYTLDTLSVFVGCVDFDSFQNLSAEPCDSVWAKVLKSANSITNYTLTTIANNSLVDFNHTIERDSLNLQLDEFVVSEKNLTSVVAPSGYGKSIALAKWVLSLNRTTDIVLFTHSSVCLTLFDYRGESANGISLNLQNLNNTLHQLCNDDESADRRFILIIDALDELFYQPVKLKQFYQRLIELSLNKECSKFLNIVFSVRDTVFNGFLQKESNIDALVNYFSLKGTDTASNNIPPLSDNEISQLVSDKSVLSRFDTLPLHVKAFLRIPINFKLFIEEGTNKTNNAVSEVALYRGFFNRHLFEVSFSEEKQDIVWMLIELIVLENEDYSINKSKLKEIFPIHLRTEKDYYLAYSQLLQDGIISEEHNPHRYGFTNIKVRFKHLKFFYFLYALKTVADNGDLCAGLLSQIANGSDNKNIKTQLISTLYQLAYEDNNYEALKDVWHLDVEVIDNYLFRETVGSCLRQENDIKQALITNYASNPIAQECYFSRFVDINSLNIGYIHQIEAYRQNVNTNESKLFTNALFYYSAFLKMDTVACCERFQILQESIIDNSISAYPLARKYAYELLHFYYIEKRDSELSLEDILDHQNQAYRIDKHNLKEQYLFEVTITLALLLTQKYTLLNEYVIHTFKIDKNVALNSHRSFIRKHHTSILLAFRYISLHKQGFIIDDNAAIKHCEIFLETYIDVKDSYQYAVPICIFLMEYCQENVKQIYYYTKAMAIATESGYNFFEELIKQSSFRIPSVE